MRKAIFLDRDGVINDALFNPDEGKWDSPYTLDEFRMRPGVAQGISMINQMGFLAVVVSNQPGVAKGKCDLPFLNALNDKMHQLLNQDGARLDAIYYCLHHPDAKRVEYRAVCDCRKPQPGLLLRSARELGINLGASYMIGDSITDVEAGLTAGCKSILLAVDPVLPQGTSPHAIYSDLVSAVQRIRWDTERTHS